MTYSSYIRLVGIKELCFFYFLEIVKEKLNY